MRNYPQLLLAATLGIPLVCTAQTTVQDFNKDWKFTLSDSACYALPNYSAEHWRSVILPHDWSIELPFDSINGEGCTAYLPGGIGWYNKTFSIDKDNSKKYYLVFDGVYNNSEYWINGRKVGIQPSGYAPFYFDITDYLKPANQNNTLAVRVDHSHYVDSRWYTGSGIYRDVKLVTTDKLHIPVWGTFITTPEVSKQLASINAAITIRNDYDDAKKGKVVTKIWDKGHKLIASTTTKFELDANSQQVIDQDVDITSPQLWDVETPYLYSAESQIWLDEKVVASQNTTFGIRSIRFDADKGFFLNDVNMKIKGVCLHHDAGIVGAAFIKDVWVRRLQQLKSMGCNAIRTSHNPAADAFLSLCDEMGFLVQEEFFDEWDNPKDKRRNMQEIETDVISQGYGVHFQQWAEHDLKNTMLRSRNHPCIFQWSIGNEIEWTYPGCREATGFFGADSNGNYFWNRPPYDKEKIKQKWNERPAQPYDIGQTAHKLARWTKEMDTTRPVIANCILPSVSYETGYVDALDIVGYSYRRVIYDYGKENYPNKPIMATESLGQWHEWKSILERDFIAGMFVWTGIDYLGERGPKQQSWPNKILASGFLDACGFQKPSYDMFKSIWTETPSIAIYSQTAAHSSYKVKDGKIVDKKTPWDKRLWVWDDVNDHWNYNEGDSIIVEVYSNCDEVELSLDHRSLGKKKLSDFPDHIYKWAVAYKPGKLVAKGTKKGETVKTFIQTVGEKYAIKITSDKHQLQRNNDNTLHVIAQLVDKKGNRISHEEADVEFEISGAYKLLGIDNGYIGNVSPYQSTRVKTYKGRCLLLLQPTDQAGTINIQAKSNGMLSNSISIDVTE